MQEKVRRGKGGTQKWGRNKAKCEQYKREHRRENNKIVKLSAMIKRLSPKNNMRIEIEKRIEELRSLT